MEVQEKEVSSQSKIRLQGRLLLETPEKEKVPSQVRSWFEEFFSEGKRRMEKKKEASPFTEIPLRRL